MGLSNKMNTPKDEESLPLYSNLEYDDINPGLPLTLPEATATPDVVRDFLVRLLVTRRSLPLDQARRIAARWNMGSGRELWIYSPAMYNTIFGPEDGWVVCKDVKVLYNQTEQAKKGFLRRHIADIIAVVLVLWIVSLVTWAIVDYHSEGQLVIIVFGTIFGAVGLLFAVVVGYVERNRNAENDVEAELQRSFFTNNGTIPQHGVHN